jgi:hypothetical protein
MNSKATCNWLASGVLTASCEFPLPSRNIEISVQIKLCENEDRQFKVLNLAMAFAQLRT